MNPFIVDRTQSAGLAEVLASLPASLAPEGDDPQLAFIEGTPDWPEFTQAALNAGALAAVVSSPSTKDNGFVSKEAAERVILAWDFAENPGVRVAAAAAIPLQGTAVLAEAILTAPTHTDVETALLDMMTALTRIAGHLTQLRTLYRNGTGWYLAAELENGAPVSISLLITDTVPRRLNMRLLTIDGGLNVIVPAPDTAAPAEVRVVGPEGELLLPTLWETSHRASWRRAVALAGGTEISGDIEELRRIAKRLPTSMVGR